MIRYESSQLPITTPSDGYTQRVLICDVLQLHMDGAAQGIADLGEDPFVDLSQYLLPEGGYVDGGYDIEEVPDEEELQRRVGELPDILELFVHDGLISPATRATIAQELDLSQQTAPPSPVPMSPGMLGVQAPLF